MNFTENYENNCLGTKVTPFTAQTELAADLNKNRFYGHVKPSAGALKSSFTFSMVVLIGVPQRKL